MARKAKIYMEKKLAMDAKGNRNGFPESISGKQKSRGNVGPLLKVAKDLVSQGMEQAEVLNTFFASDFTSKPGLQLLDQMDSSDLF